MAQAAEDFCNLSPRSHALCKPTMYIGSTAVTPREDWVYDAASGEMQVETVSMPAAVERLYFEILSNACDNVGKSRKAGISPMHIGVEVSASTVSVISFGLGVPIERSVQDPDLYVPEMIFGRMLSGSNYGKRREGNGTNGIGAKAANIFSTRFEIEVVTFGVRYVQEWTANMRQVGAPRIDKTEAKHNSVRVTYELDFARFGIAGYDETAVKLFWRHALDASFTAKVPVEFNGERRDVSKIKELARLYYGEEVARTGIGLVDGGIEAMYLDTPDCASTISFVNCMPTREGGLHVDAAYKVFSDDAKKRLGALLGADEAKCPITVKDIKTHVSLILSAQLPCPDFSSQSKEKLVSWREQDEDAPQSSYELAAREFPAMKKWQLLSALVNHVQQKRLLNVKRERGALSKRSKVAKAVDANKCKNGPEERRKCVLCVTEGNSAQGYFEKMMKCFGDAGRDYYGILPLRGKGLNVMKASEERILKNDEIDKISSMLNLVPGVDYSDDRYFSKLRYGGFMIMTDADVDGKHVAGLILNFFYCRYPSLLRRGYLVNYITPILRASKGKTVLPFFSMPAYNAWRETTDSSGWLIKYYKGLGTSKDQDVASDVARPRKVVCELDADADAAMKLAFDYASKEGRKGLVADWHQDTEREYEGSQPLSHFVYNDLVQYSVDSVRRAIPKLVDGLKVSQRKILYGVMKKFKVAIGAKYAEDRTAQVAVYCSEVSHYHHGDSGLADTLTKMCQSFVGSNNLPLFVADCSIGTRRKLGKDAAHPRYTQMRPSELLPYIFRQEDDCLLEHTLEEEHPAEPEQYYPIIPMCLINGAQGIGTGSSTFVPNHNPLDCVAWILAWLAGAETPAVHPWYREYRGLLKMVRAKSRKREYDAMLSQGVFTTEKGRVHVSEIPLLISTHKYATKFLGGLEEAKIIKEYDDYSVDDQVRYVLHGWKGAQYPSLENLHLTRTHKLTNMVLLDQDSMPVHYTSSEDILVQFAEERLERYAERKRHFEASFAAKLKAARDKKRYIEAIVHGELDIRAFDAARVYAFMEEHGLDRKLIDSTSTRDLCPDAIDRQAARIAELQRQAADYASRSPADLWRDELEQFRTKYLKVYKDRAEDWTISRQVVQG